MSLLTSPTAGRPADNMLKASNAKPQKCLKEVMSCISRREEAKAISTRRGGTTQRRQLKFQFYVARQGSAAHLLQTISGAASVYEFRKLATIGYFNTLTVFHRLQLKLAGLRQRKRPTYLTAAFRCTLS